MMRKKMGKKLYTDYTIAAKCALALRPTYK